MLQQFYQKLVQNLTLQLVGAKKSNFNIFNYETDKCRSRKLTLAI